MKYTTIFFDLDDTLWDTAANSEEALKEIYEKYPFHNHYPIFKEFSALFFTNNIKLWNDYAEGLITKEELTTQRFFRPYKQIEGITPSSALEINKEYMERTALKKRLIKGAIELLDNLKPHYRLCILSNGFEEIQYKKIDNGNLSFYFEKIILSDHIGINKPHRSLFEYALREMNTAADKAIMIGDNWKTDILGARNSGIDQIWFNPNNEKREDFFPNYIVKELVEINNILLS